MGCRPPWEDAPVWTVEAAWPAPRGWRPQGVIWAPLPGALAISVRPPGRTITSVVQRPPTGTIPDAPGSYQFKDAEGRVVYVGKAASLRQRLSNYFADPSGLHPRTAQMVATAETVEWIQVRNEVEALLLENSLIKQHKPRFNVRLRDDKSYPFLAVTLDEEWPRARDEGGVRRTGLPASGPAAGPAHGGAHDQRAAADGGRRQRVPPRHRRGRGRARSGHPGVLRPPGPVRAAQGLHRPQRRGPD